MKTIKAKKDETIFDVIVKESGLSKSAVKRLIKQGGVKVRFPLKQS